MKRSIQLSFATVAISFCSLSLLISCRHSPEEPSKGSAVFFFKLPDGTTEAPTTATISINDNNGNVIEDHTKVSLTASNNGYVSTEIVLDAAGEQQYHLTGFKAFDNSDKLLYQLKGTDLAFDVTPNQTNTITVEVSDAVENIQVSVSAYIKWNNEFQTTGAHLKAEGLSDSTSANPTILWTTEVDLIHGENSLSLKKSPAYRITITKTGSENWEKVTGLKSANVKADLNNTVDIYVAGFITDATHGKTAVVLKNGVITKQDPNTTSYANDVYVNGTDVFATGVMTDKAEENFMQGSYWKNGQRLNLPFFGYSKTVFYSGTDFYLGGTQYSTGDPTSQHLAFYVKNTVIHYFSGLFNGSMTLADIDVNGTDVYGVGTQLKDGVPKNILWKNEEVSQLPDDFVPSYITIKNNSIYIAGNIDGKTAYMKDGQVTNLQPLSSTQGFEVTDDGDIYLLSLNAKYWKNGQQTSIPGDGANCFDFSIVDDKVFVLGTARQPASDASSVAVWIDGDPVWGSMDVTPYAIHVVKK